MKTAKIFYKLVLKKNIEAKMPTVLIFSMLTLTFVQVTFGQLVVNVKNKGGDVERENIESNTTADTVKLEYLSKDATLVTYFIDFKAVSEALARTIYKFETLFEFWHELVQIIVLGS